MIGELWAIFDTETTGLIANDARPLVRQPHIIEFAAVLVEFGERGEAKEVDSIEFFLDPGVPVTAEITRITGIKPEDVRGQRKWSERAQEVAEFFENADGVAAHNLSFDRRMLGIEDRRAGRVTMLPERQVCTVEGSEHLFGRRASLTELHQMLFGEPFVGAHRALVDVRATARCFAELKRRGEV